jgi:hypothetical protein
MIDGDIVGTSDWIDIVSFPMVATLDHYGLSKSEFACLGLYMAIRCRFLVLCERREA